MNQEKQLRRKNYRAGGGPYLNASELAAALGESERTILSWRHNGVIPFIDLGFRTKRYNLDAVLRALEKRTIKAK